MFLETVCFFYSVHVSLLGFFYLYKSILGMLGKHCVTRDSSSYLTYKTDKSKQNLTVPYAYFILFPHLFMPYNSFNKKKRRELKKTKTKKKQNN